MKAAGLVAMAVLLLLLAAGFALRAARSGTAQGAGGSEPPGRMRGPDASVAAKARRHSKTARTEPDRWTARERALAVVREVRRRLEAPGAVEVVVAARTEHPREEWRVRAVFSEAGRGRALAFNRSGVFNELSKELDQRARDQALSPEQAQQIKPVQMTSFRTDELTEDERAGATHAGAEWSGAIEFTFRVPENPD